MTTLKKISRVVTVFDYIASLNCAMQSTVSMFPCLRIFH